METDTGTIGWMDITVADAVGLRDLYASVVGWEPQGVDMGGGRCVVVEDPSGTVAALYQAP